MTKSESIDDLHPLVRLIRAHELGGHYNSRHLGGEAGFESQCKCGTWFPMYGHARHLLEVLFAAGLDVTTERRTNIDDALEIVHQIDQVRAVIRELKAAFARSELDGGVKAAPRHPLYIQCEQRLETLHEQLMMVI